MYSPYSESLPAIHVNAGLIHLQHKLECSRAAQDDTTMTLSNSRQQFLACESREGDLQYERKGGCFISRPVCCVLVLVVLVVAIIAAVAGYFFALDGARLLEGNDMWTESDLKEDASAQAFRRLRLPSIVKPSYYRLKLIANLEESVFKGEVYITLRSSSDNIDKIILHSKNLNISKGVTVTEQVLETLQTIQDPTVRRKRQTVTDTTDSPNTQTTSLEQTNKENNEVTYAVTAEDRFHHDRNTLVTHSNTRNIPVTLLEMDNKTEQLIIHLETPLKQETNYILQIKFNGNITDSLTGFYKSTYLDANKRPRTMAITQFESTYARTAFPCFDEPQFKAMFEISIAHRNNVTALSNMPVASNEDMVDNPGWTWTHFDRSVKMSTYLVAYGVMGFQYLETSYVSKDNITKPIKVWCKPELINNARYAIKIVPKVLAYYEELFGSPYVLNKLDLVAVPDFSSGAMENWGLVTFRETTLLYDEKSKVAHDKQAVAVDVAHELAHQWFGNLVTMAWWTDLWLNEGFATYVEYMGANVIAPELNMLDVFTTVKMNLLRSDSLKSTSPVSKEVLEATAAEISQKFDEISYDKGASLIRMLNHTISEKLFHQGLVAYLDKWKFSNAVEKDLWASMSEAISDEPSLSHINIASFMDTWTKQAGFPVVTVDRDYNTGDVLFTQNLFTTQMSPISESRRKQIWYIPISYSTIDTTLGAWDTTAKFWLNERELRQNLPVNSTQALYVNVDSIGYYRVNYDTENWHLLSKALDANWEIIPQLTRAQLLDDAFNLAKVGQLTYNSTLDLTTYLMKGEDSRIVWDMVLGDLAFLKFTLKSTPFYGDFQDYILTLITPALKRHNYGLDAPRDDEESILIENLLLWECYSESQRCISWARTHFQEWMNQTDPSNNNNPIPSNLRGLVYSIALRYGGRAELDFLWRMYENASDPGVRETIVSSLTSTRDESLIRLLLERSLTVIPSQYAANAWNYDSIAGSAVAQEVFVQQWNRIYDKFSKMDTFILGGILGGAFNYICNDEQLEEFKRFVISHKSQLKPYQQSILKLVDAATLRIRWVERHAGNIARWLRDFNQRQNQTGTDATRKFFPSIEGTSIVVADPTEPPNTNVMHNTNVAPMINTGFTTDATKSTSYEIQKPLADGPKSTALSNNEVTSTEKFVTFSSTNVR